MFNSLRATNQSYICKSVYSWSCPVARSLSSYAFAPLRSKVSSSCLKHNVKTRPIAMMSEGQDGAGSDKQTVTLETQANGHGKVQVNGANGENLNAWQTPGPAAYDFRSDTSTTPTASMLASLATTTLLDDVSHADPTTNELEARCAALLGHEAGILVLSGTMGNQLAALTTLRGPPHAVLADARAHILTHEAGGLSFLSGAHPQPVHPTSSSNKAYLTLEDVVANAELPSGDFHLSPTRLIALENTLGGAIMPQSEAARITAWARHHGIATHLDGARLWEAVAAQVAAAEEVDNQTTSPAERQEKSASTSTSTRAALEAGLRAYGSLFDSATVCFSKGLGAPLGSVLVGRREWVERARHLRKMLGGGMRMTGVVAAPAAVAVEETFFGGKLLRSHALALRVKGFWEALGGDVVGAVDTNMVWLDMRAAGVGDEVIVEEAGREGLSVYPGRIMRVVCHYQISDDAVEKLGKVLERCWARRDLSAASSSDGKGTGFRYGAGAGEEKKAEEEKLEKVDCA